MTGYMSSRLGRGPRVFGDRRAVGQIPQVRAGDLLDVVPHVALNLKGRDVFDPTFLSVFQGIDMRTAVAFEKHVDRLAFFKSVQEAVIHDVYVLPVVAKELKGFQAARSLSSSRT
jgi:hypothetical protein